MHDCGGHPEPSSPWLLDAYTGHAAVMAASHQTQSPRCSIARDWCPGETGSGSEVLRSFSRVVPGISDPALVGEEAPGGVELVVAEAFGDEVDLPDVDGRNPVGLGCQGVIDGCPERVGGGGRFEFEGDGFLHFPVERRVADEAIAFAAVATEEEWEVGGWIGGVGEPA